MNCFRVVVVIVWALRHTIASVVHWIHHFVNFHVISRKKLSGETIFQLQQQYTHHRFLLWFQTPNTASIAAIKLLQLFFTSFFFKSLFSLLIIIVCCQNDLHGHRQQGIIHFKEQEGFEFLYCDFKTIWIFSCASWEVSLDENIMNFQSETN